VFHLNTIIGDTALKSTYDCLSLQAIIPFADCMIVSRREQGKRCAAGCSVSTQLEKDSNSNVDRSVAMK